MPNIYTAPSIAKKFGVPMHVLQHALNRYDIKPIGRVGIARIFAESQLAEIRGALNRTSRTPILAGPADAATL